MDDYSKPLEYNQADSSATLKRQRLKGLRNARDIAMRSIYAIATSSSGLLVSDLENVWLVDGQPANNSTVNTGVAKLFKVGVLDRVREGNAYRYRLSEQLSLDDVKQEMQRRGLAMPTGLESSLFDLSTESSSMENLADAEDKQVSSGGDQDGASQPLISDENNDVLHPPVSENQMDEGMGERSAKFFSSLTDALAEFNAMERKFDSMRSEIDYLKSQNTKLTQELEHYRNQQLAHAAVERSSLN